MTELDPMHHTRKRPPIWRQWLLPSAAVFAALLPVRALGAQLLRVEAVEELSGRPAAGAIVEVLDSTANIAAQVVLSADGRREVILVRPGTFRVRLRRIGFRPYLSDPVVVERAPVDLRLTVPARRVTLAAVEVTAARCAADAFRDEGVAALWDQIHTALTSTSLGRSDTSTVFETRAFRRTIERDGRVRAVEIGLPRAMTTSRPFVALPAAELSRHGYVQLDTTDNTLLFHGPDEDVLRSPEFIASHCFAVVRGTGTTVGLLGMHFTPAGAGERDRRAVNDIAGTLWIDPVTSELRHIDFQFVSSTLPRAAQGDSASGGQVVFERLPTGLWIVGAWKLRMPRLTYARTIRARSVDGFDEYGGVVTPRDAIGMNVPVTLAPYHALLARGAIEGTVFDSLAMRPLAGARVWLVPIESPAVVRAGLAPPGELSVAPTSIEADAEGRWSLSGVEPGSYRVGFEHPAIDSLGLTLSWPEVRLNPGAELRVALTGPSLAGLVAGCKSMREGDRQPRGALIGTVRSADGGPAPAATVVRASWQERSPDERNASRATVLEANGTLAPDGTYLLCGVPRDVPLDVRATTAADTTPVRRMFVPATGLARVHLGFAPTPDSGTVVAAAVAGAAPDPLARRAAAGANDDLARVHWRRVGGHSHVLAGDTLRRHENITSILRDLPGVRLEHDQRTGESRIVMRTQKGGECQPGVFVDRTGIDSARLLRLAPAVLTAVELIATPARAPVYTTGARSASPGEPCGTLLLWTQPDA